MLINPSAGILGVATGKSSDHPGEGAIILYVDESMNVSVPATVDGVRPWSFPPRPSRSAFGTAPQLPSSRQRRSVPARRGAQLGHNRQAAGRASLMRGNSAFFGVGVGQSLDNPREAALVVYVDRRQVPAQLPATVDGLRTRYIVMDRMHVTRSYAVPIRPKHNCTPASRSAARLRPARLIPILGV